MPQKQPLYLSQACFWSEQRDLHVWTMVSSKPLYQLRCATSTASQPVHLSLFGFTAVSCSVSDLCEGTSTVTVQAG